MSSDQWSDAVNKIIEVMGAGRLSRAHAAQLASSAIAPAVVKERGYRTIEFKDASTLAVGYGFADYQRRTPGLLIPLWDVHGKQVTAIYRPDAPRSDRQRGRVIKYESPANGRIILDVPPRCQPHLKNPAKALWILEGSKKADCAASLDLVAISISGVWNWRGGNSEGGLTVLPDWDDVALNDRRVIICFDSDSETKAEVQVALRRLAAWLGTKDARVFIAHLPASLPKREDLDG